MQDENSAEQKGVLVRLIIRITIYYVFVSGAVAALLAAFPGLIAVLPIGGIVDYTPELFQGASQIINETADAEATSWMREATSLFLAMFITLIAMVPVAWLYKAIHEGHDYDHSIDETALVMPAVVAGVVTVAQQSLALAFSLAGIVAGVRFRRALSDTFDTLFIFVAIGVGLAAGVGAIEIAIVITVFFNYATATICIFGDGLESKYVADKERRRIQRKTPKKKKKKKKPTRALAGAIAAGESASVQDAAPSDTAPSDAAPSDTSPSDTGPAEPETSRATPTDPPTGG